MPVARGDDEVEAVQERVDRLRDLGALHHGQRTARREIVWKSTTIRKTSTWGIVLGSPDTSVRPSTEGSLRREPRMMNIAVAGAGREERAWSGAPRMARRRASRRFSAATGRARTAPLPGDGDAAAAEDIAQEGFLSALRALDRFDRRRPFGPWLHRIVVNRAIDWSRARALRHEVGRARRSSPPSPAPQNPYSDDSRPRSPRFHPTSAPWS